MRTPTKVTDLDAFVLEHVYRPYAFNLNGQEFKGLGGEYTLENSVNLLTDKKHSTWSMYVVNRIGEIQFRFPSYIKHPLVDFLANELPEAVFVE